MRNAVIRSSGMYAPERIITNQFFNELLGEDVDTWLRDNLTIRERRWCAENESTADLCKLAAEEALINGGINASDIDLIIIATDTPEFISPSTASVVQYRLGAVKAGTFDINTACAGFVTALDTATKFIIADDRYKNVLVIGAYAMSKYLNLKDKKTVTLFADGAGAIILESYEGNDRGCLTSSLYTEGEYCEWMGIYAGGTKIPVTHEVIDNEDHLLRFVKKFPKELNPATWTRMIKESSQRINISPSQIDHFFFTQININSIRETLEMLGTDMSKAHLIMDRYGYTGSACIPMAFAEAMRNNKLKTGDLLCFMGSGGGLAFANSIYRL